MHFNPDLLIKGIRVYKTGYVETIRKSPPANDGVDLKGGERKPIKYLSSKARANMLAILMTTAIQFNSMATLTYPDIYPTDGIEVKQNIRHIMQSLKRKWGTEYFWFLEFQRRGAPHLHVMTEVKSPSDKDRLMLAEKWANAIGLTKKGNWIYKAMDSASREQMRDNVIAVHRHPKSWEDVRSSDGAIRYCAKYALKTKQKFVPSSYQNVGRFWACSQGVKKSVVDSVDYDIREGQLRDILENDGHIAATFDYLPKHLFGAYSLAILAHAAGSTDNEGDRPKTLQRQLI